MKKEILNPKRDCQKYHKDIGAVEKKARGWELLILWQEEMVVATTRREQETQK